MSEALSEAQWARLEHLFHAACELPADQRDAFIVRETAADDQIAAALRGMLAAERAPVPIGNIVESAARALQPAEQWLGRQFGPYRIVREIGRGGMGLVFEAVRSDDEYRKRVALKIASWWRGTAESRDRFRAERQLLAELEHPNIARFLDGGTEQGTPYFVMEYVEGQPITQYCEQHQLAVRARLTLFRTLCDGVRFAHERLIVHRDLKPANILVGADHVPKLLDFGVAKLLDAKADAAMTAGGAMWTPDYASPEQVRGQAVTTRTDVYSLGLVLYELLAGARAQVADTSSPIALDRSVTALVPPAPSAQASSRGDEALARALRGDLDTIVMTAIRKEPERRYASVSALADDISRYLAGAPIQARDSTIGYRTGKFLRRHWTAAAAAAILILSVAAGSVATLYQARRAERRFDEVRTLANAFVFDVHDRIASLPGATEARKAIVQTALTYLEHLREETGGDAALAREIATAYTKVGDVQGDPLGSNLGDTPGAIVSYNRAEQLLAPLAAGGDQDAMRGLALVRRKQANVLQSKGELQPAVAALEHSYQLAAGLVARNAGDREALKLEIETASHLSRLAVTLLDYEVAERAARQAVDAAQRIVALDPSARDVRDGVATAHNALGGVQLLSDKLSEAADTFRASVEIREKLVAEDPENASWRRNLMISLGNLADVLAYRAINLGDRAGGLAALDRAVALAQWAIDNDKADRRAPFDAASALLRRGAVRCEYPSLVDAGLDDLRLADRLVASLLESDAQSERYRYLAFVIDYRRGVALVRAGRVAEATAVLERGHTRGLRFAKGGVYEGSVRAVGIEITTELARLRARAGDPRTTEMIRVIAAELGRGKLDRPYDAAALHGELGRIYIEWSRHQPARRAELIEKGRQSLEESATRWRAAKLHPAQEPRRQEALAAIEAELAAVPSR
jgi:eukaryotic-like serine/threonine-protein kinase